MVKEILIDCFSQIDDVSMCEKLENITDVSNLIDEIKDFDETDQDKIKLMVRLLANVINSVTKSYLKNYIIDRVKSDEEGRVYYTSLSKPIVSVKNVSDEMNSYIVYKTYFDHIKLPYKNTTFDICYNFETTAFSSLFDEVCVPLGLSSYCLSLGVVSAYFQIKLLYREAELFESKFKSELSQIKTNNGNRSFFVWRG